MIEHDIYTNVFCLFLALGLSFSFCKALGIDNISALIAMILGVAILALGYMLL